GRPCGVAGRQSHRRHPADDRLRRPALAPAAAHHRRRGRRRDRLPVQPARLRRHRSGPVRRLRLQRDGRLSGSPPGGGMTADETDRPWEREGAGRRDCVPDRAVSLFALGVLAAGLGGVSVCCLWPSLVGLPLAVAVWRMARHDLAEMTAGRMDRVNRDLTDGARQLGVGGLVVNAITLSGTALYAAALILDKGLW